MVDSLASIDAQSQYISYEDDSIVVIGVLRQNILLCRDLAIGGQCHQGFNSAEELQTHFETAHSLSPVLTHVKGSTVLNAKRCALRNILVQAADCRISRKFGYMEISVELQGLDTIYQKIKTKLIHLLDPTFPIGGLSPNIGVELDNKQH